MAAEEADFTGAENPSVERFSIEAYASELQSQVESLRRRLEELELDNKKMLSRISGCPRCSKKDDDMFLAASMRKDGLPSREFGKATGSCFSDSSNTRTSGLDNTEQASNGHGKPVEGVDHNSVEGISGCRLRNMDHCKTRHVALKIMYFGQRFYGFASEAHSEPTIESEIFKALARTKLGGSMKLNVNYSRCGRTDKGVSSTGQVISLHLRSTLNSSEHRHEEIDYVKVLNGVLPKDIRVMGWCPVPTNFHSRFSCLGREYKYFFWRGEMDIVAMQNAGKKFTGEHDFRNFCKMDAINVSNYRRQITLFEISSCNQRYGSDELYAITIRGSAFLWHQVRCMVALLFMIGQGLESSTIIDILLDIRKVPRKPQYTMAQELPLVLRSCEFENLSFFCSADAKRALAKDLNSTIQSYLLQAAIFSEALNCLPMPVTGGTTVEHNKKARGHIPLLCRPTEPSFEERRAKIDRKSNKGKNH